MSGRCIQVFQAKLRLGGNQPGDTNVFETCSSTNISPAWVLMQTILSCPIETLKGIILGGPGPTKYDFEKGDYLNYQLKNKILDVIDTAYVEEQGVKEIVDKAPEIMRKVRYIEEKEVMQKFLYEVGHDTGYDNLW